MLAMTDREDRTQQLISAGNWLAKARRDAGLTQDEIGDAIGTSGANISNYELGKNRVPEGKVGRLAAALGLGELETRRALGMYVPPGADDAPVRQISTEEAIKRDPRLIPEARRHLLNQLELLSRITAKAEQPDAELLDLPHAARKRTPRKPRP